MRWSLACDGAAELCAEIRAAGVWTPILVLAPVCDARCIAALDAGADDCEIDPVAPRRARGSAARPGATRPARAAQHPHRRVAAPGPGYPTRVRPRDAAADRGRAVRPAGAADAPRGPGARPAADIAEHVWDWAWEARSNAIDVHVHHLRSVLRLGPRRSAIDTVRGIGYRLEARARAASDRAISGWHLGSCSFMQPGAGSAYRTRPPDHGDHRRRWS